MSLSFRRTVKTLMDDQTAAGAGNWVRLDNSFNNVYNALITVSLENGDWVQLQGRLEPSDRAMNVSIAVVSATGYVASDGPFFEIRAVKTGTAGKARVVTYG